jgi:hypothetical protein
MEERKRSLEQNRTSSWSLINRDSDEEPEKTAEDPFASFSLKSTVNVDISFP